MDIDLSHVMMEQVVKSPAVIGAWSHVSLASSSQSADRLYFSVQAVLYLWCFPWPGALSFHVGVAQEAAKDLSLDLKTVTGMLSQRF